MNRTSKFSIWISIVAISLSLVACGIEADDTELGTESVNGKGDVSENSAPVEIGNTYDVVITELAKMGDGIARINGFVIFVPDTKVEDQVRIEIKRVMQRFAIAEVKEYLQRAGAEPQTPAPAAEEEEAASTTVEAGKTYDVVITELAKQGDGIARINGFVIFVTNYTTLNVPIKVEIDRVMQRFAIGHKN